MSCGKNLTGNGMFQGGKVSTASSLRATCADSSSSRKAELLSASGVENGYDENNETTIKRRAAQVDFSA